MRTQPNTCPSREWASVVGNTDCNVGTAAVAWPPSLLAAGAAEAAATSVRCTMHHWWHSSSHRWSLTELCFNSFIKISHRHHLAALAAGDGDAVGVHSHHLGICGRQWQHHQ